MHDNEKLLKSYIATTGYTILGIENTIEDLKRAVSVTENTDLISIYQNRIEELDNHLAVIAHLD